MVVAGVGRRTLLLNSPISHYGLSTPAPSPDAIENYDGDETYFVHFSVQRYNNRPLKWIVFVANGALIPLHIRLSARPRQADGIFLLAC